MNKYEKIANFLIEKLEAKRNEKEKLDNDKAITQNNLNSIQRDILNSKIKINHLNELLTLLKNKNKYFLFKIYKILFYLFLLFFLYKLLFNYNLTTIQLFTYLLFIVIIGNDVYSRTYLYDVYKGIDLSTSEDDVNDELNEERKRQEELKSDKALIEEQLRKEQDTLSIIDEEIKLLMEKLNLVQTKEELALKYLVSEPTIEGRLNAIFEQDQEINDICNKTLKRYNNRLI